MEATVTKSILYFHVFIRMKLYVDGALKDVLEKDPPLLLSAQLWCQVHVITGYN